MRMVPHNASVASACLSSEHVEQLLSGSASEHEVVHLSAHISLCSDCQNLLESRTAIETCTEIADDQRSLWANLQPSMPTDEPSSLRRRLIQSGLLEPLSEQPTGPFMDGQTKAEHRDAEHVEFPAIDGYDVTGRLGAGGMGEVYQARQHSLKRDVAIKVLRSKHSTEARQRFQREIEAVGRLEHEHIVRAYDAGEVDGQPFLVMELIEGRDLSNRLRQHGPLNVDEACRLAQQAALGLQTAHDAGLVHRDVKPGNLMITETGTLKVLDLGLASADASRPLDGVIADENVILGSLDYMAPEQGCDERSADVRSDVYALGCTLFTLLSGKPPFRTNKLQTAAQKLLAHGQSERPNVLEHRDDVSEELAHYIQRMMSIDPDERPASMQQVATTLGGFRAGYGDSGGGRKGTIIAVAAIGFLLLLSVIVIKFKDGSSMTINTDKPVADTTLKDADKIVSLTVDGVKQSPPTGKAGAMSRGLIATLHEDAVKAFSFGATTNEAYLLCDDGRLLHWRPNAKKDKVTEIYDVRSAGASRIGKVTEFLPGKDAVIFGTMDGLSRLNLKTKQLDWVIPGSANIQLALVPEKNLLLHGRQTETTVRHISTGEAVVTLPVRPGTVPCVGPDSTRVSICDRLTGEVFVYNLTADVIATSEKIFTRDGFKATDAAISTDSKYLITVGRSLTIIWDIDSGAIVRETHTRYKVDQSFVKRLGDSQWFATLRGQLRNKLVIWDPILNQVRDEREIPSTRRILISRNGQRALTMDFGVEGANFGENLRLWNLNETVE